MSFLNRSIWAKFKTLQRNKRDSTENSIPHLQALFFLAGRKYINIWYFDVNSILETGKITKIRRVFSKNEIKITEKTRKFRHKRSRIIEKEFQISNSNPIHFNKKSMKNYKVNENKNKQQKKQHTVAFRSHGDGVDWTGTRENARERMKTEMTKFGRFCLFPRCNRLS